MSIKPSSHLPPLIRPPSSVPRPPAPVLRPPSSIPSHLSSIASGFSRKAAVYDDYCAGNAAVQWSLNVIRKRVLALLPPHAELLELNAGTGRDALWFAQRGVNVHATDVAAGMLDAIADKAATHNALHHTRITHEAADFQDLRAVLRPADGYDLIFSNFGGLNCAEDLTAVCAQFHALLKPGGHVALVVMPPLCPWELAQALRGHFKTATRRLHAGGTRAHVEGAHFVTRYFSPATVLRALGLRFNDAHLQAISLFSPPSFVERFPARLPRVFNALTRLDEATGRWPMLRSMGDYVLITARAEIQSISGEARFELNLGKERA